MTRFVSAGRRSVRRLDYPPPLWVKHRILSFLNRLVFSEGLVSYVPTPGRWQVSPHVGHADVASAQGSVELTQSKDEVSKTMSNTQPIEIRIELEFEPTHAEASKARQAVGDHLRQLSVAPEVVADVELVVAELAANAVEQQPELPIKLTIKESQSHLAITVSNASTGIGTLDDGSSPGDDGSAGGLAERGWGLNIIQTITDAVSVINADGWTSVRCLIGLRKASG